MLKCGIKAEMIGVGEAYGLSLDLSNGETRIYKDVTRDGEAMKAFVEK